ncbi:MAG: ribonuclease P protein component [Candidatus Yanofskybacteria bacterium RIFCSPLOWO2_01_FULL_41_34]|uniref:Ribonuclease P protein component n=1 Tax=Candidatus Yanofskybacteria bacterium RIFCSPHIGHO2_01_FULL_41_26 TaxID=1802661 RepID=A0A1F8ECJ7_9BACT|nr:MAG: ribonuclease P protein component [Candidatus Yanofskybacteria bacterium RIFCSPHIGHO2_01_FULL_41_26]OGN21657.1 MAG: ribonuclease P protein component [Candidatus Yanofskybacteria bacterium RIFCSPLOWO2_01_FULL_41_34]
MALNKKNRLKKKRDFDEVLKKGKAVSGSFLFIKYKKNELGVPRFGFVVSAKIAKKAVERNKIRRILSGAVGKILDDLGGHDVIVFATTKATAVRRKDVAEDFLRILKKIQ